MIKISAVLFAIFFSIGGCNKQRKQSTSSGIVRNAHSMAYNKKEGKIYLFGGANEMEVLSELCVFENNNWKVLNGKNAPSPRTFACFVYDDLYERLILFGGSKVLFGDGPDSTNLLNDTWEYKNNKWTLIRTTKSPMPRAEASMVYNEKTKTILLFGGYTITGQKYISLNDTWEFKDNEWNLLSTSGPSARHGASIVFHKQLNEAILFGGRSIDEQFGPNSGETWAWEGTLWTKLDISQPAGVFNSTMNYVDSKNEIVRYGGWNGKERIGETWIFRNNSWYKLDVTNYPRPRNHASSIYDLQNDRIILFGGHDSEYVFGDTWEFKDNEWNRLSFNKAKRRVANGH